MCMCAGEYMCVCVSYICMHAHMHTNMCIWVVCDLSCSESAQDHQHDLLSTLKQVNSCIEVAHKI